MSSRSRRFRRSILVAAAVSVGALLALPATGTAFKFGSELDNTVQPSNAPLECDQGNPAAVCTFVMNDAYGRPNGGEKAQRKGKITKIRMIPAESGSAVLQIARANENGTGGDWQGKLVRKGPKLNFQGDPDPNDDVYPVRVFKLKKPLPVNKGDRIALKTKVAQAVRCSSGGDNTLLFNPVLGDAFNDVFNTDGCWLLVEAVAKNA